MRRFADETELGADTDRRRAALDQMVLTTAVDDLGPEPRAVPAGQMLRALAAAPRRSLAASRDGRLRRRLSLRRIAADGSTPAEGLLEHQTAARPSASKQFVGEGTRLGRRRPPRLARARTQTLAATFECEGFGRSLGRATLQRRARHAEFERGGKPRLMTPSCGGLWGPTRSGSSTSATARAANAARRRRRIASRPSADASPPGQAHVQPLATSALLRPCPKRVIRRQRPALLGEKNFVTKSTCCMPLREFTMTQLAMAESKMLRNVEGEDLWRRAWAMRALARAGQALHRTPPMRPAAWRGMTLAS